MLFQDLRDLTGSDLRLGRQLLQNLCLRVRRSSSSASVTVHVTVMPNESREFELDVDQIETSNLQSTYTVLYDQTQLAIRIKASDKNLAKLDTSQINASIDLNGMGVGDYEVPVKITLPDGYELVDSVKTTIHIKEKAVANKTTGTN